LGDEQQNVLLDILTPHTVRTEASNFWDVAADQIKFLLDTYHKPTIDDEPARCGLVEHGGIPGGTTSSQHIQQIHNVRAVGGYHIYHHDMFQNNYGHPATPDDGIPHPTFSPFHSEVFEYLKDHKAW
jgi:hypothetical protein